MAMKFKLEGTANYIKIIFGITFIFYGVCLVLLYMVEYLGVIYKHNMELEREKKLTQVERQKLELFAQTTEQLRIWKHDFQGHIYEVNALVNAQQWDKCQEYLDTLSEEISETDWGIASGNTFLDAVHRWIIKMKKICVGIVENDTAPMEQLCKCLDQWKEKNGVSLYVEKYYSQQQMVPLF